MTNWGAPVEAPGSRHVPRLPRKEFPEQNAGLEKYDGFEDMTRLNISSGTRWEPIRRLFASRARRPLRACLRHHRHRTDGSLVGKGDAYAQAIQTLRNIQSRAREGRARRLSTSCGRACYVTDISHWEQFARAHGEFFGAIRPASSMIQIGPTDRSGDAGRNRGRRVPRRRQIKIPRPKPRDNRQEAGRFQDLFLVSCPSHFVSALWGSFEAARRLVTGAPGGLTTRRRLPACPTFVNEIDFGTAD